MTVTEFLYKHVPFLQGITEDQANYLARSAEQKNFKLGQTVLLKGVTVEGLHVVASGAVSVHTRPDKTKAWTKVAELGPGEIFGETSIMEFTVAGATIKSSSDETLVFVIPESSFCKILETDAALKARILGLIESRKPKSTSGP